MNYYYDKNRELITQADRTRTFCDNSRNNGHVKPIIFL